MKSKFGRRHGTRTRLLAATVVVIVSWTFASCRSLEESEDGKFDVKVGYYPGALVSLPALVASERGLFEKHGLNAELVSVPDGPAMTSGLASGSLDFVNNSYDNLAVAVDKKLPVKAVVGNTVRVPFKLLVREGVDMPHADQGYPDVVTDLVGLKWGVIALGVSLQYLDETLLTSAGHAKDDVTFLAVGLGDSARAALDNGTVDTYIATEPLPRDRRGDRRCRCCGRPGRGRRPGGAGESRLQRMVGVRQHDRVRSRGGQALHRGQPGRLLLVQRSSQLR